MEQFFKDYGTIIWLAVLVGFFYLFLIRPQQKQQKRRGAMLESLKIGDKVLNHGGLIGTIVAIEEDKVIVNIGNKTDVSMIREGIARVIDD